MAWDVAPMPYHKPSPHLSPLQDGYIYLDGLFQACVESHKGALTHTQNCSQECFLRWPWFTVSVVSRSPCCKLKCSWCVSKPATDMNFLVSRSWCLHKWWAIAVHPAQLCTPWMRPIQMWSQTHMKANLFWEHYVIHSTAQKPLCKTINKRKKAKQWVYMGHCTPLTCLSTLYGDGKYNFLPVIFWHMCLQVK